MENEVLRDQPFYEGLSVEALEDRYSDLELRYILQRVFNMDSTVYFMGKEAKLDYIANPDSRGRILEEAESKRAVHRERNREAAERKSVGEMIEENVGDMRFRFLGVERPDGGFVDGLTQRRARVAYAIEEISGGDRFLVTRGTIRELDKADKLEGFDSKFAAGRKSVAHEAGKTTLADRLVRKESIEAADEHTESEKEEVTEKDRSPALDDELDDILNSIPS